MPWWKFRKSNERQKPLSRYLPLNKHDIATVELALTIGFPRLNSNIPEYLGWLQDRNWPVSWKMEELLLDAGPEIIPHIIKILQGDDEEWKYNLIAGLIGAYKKQKHVYFDQIKPEILRIIASPKKGEINEDVHEIAMSIMEDEQSLPIWKNRYKTLLAHGVPAEFLQTQIEPEAIKRLRLRAHLPNRFHFYRSGAWGNFEFLKGYEAIPVFDSGPSIHYNVLLIKNGNPNFVRMSLNDVKIVKEYGPNFMPMLADLLIDNYREIDELGLEQLINNGKALGFERSAELFQVVQNAHKSGINLDDEWRNSVIKRFAG